MYVHGQIFGVCRSVANIRLPGKGTRIGGEDGISFEHLAVSYVDAEVGDVEESE